MIILEYSRQKKFQPIMTKSKFYKKNYYLALAALICLFNQINTTSANTHSVLTYRESSTQLGQLTTSSTLVWESFADDKKQLEFAIKGGDYFKDEVKIPIFVCRANEQGMYVSGHTEKHEKNRYVCVVSQLNQVKIHHAFDLLVNKGHLGKVTWKRWNKYQAATPIGAIAVAMANSLSDVIYVARHNNEQNRHQGNEIHGADYNLGRFDPSVGLGKIIVTEKNDEKQFNDGEILAETEPFKYELRDIVIDKSKISKKVNRTELGSATLSNPKDNDMMVETVISYKYEKTQYWGNHEGVARGLPTTVFDKDRSETKSDSVNWGLRYSEMRVETRTVSTMLPGGTALNVTLRGNYTSMEAPYRASLIAFYEGSDEKVKRQINAVVQKATLKDISLDFSPIYWIENGTFIPTTTTTTTTTSTEATTTSTKEPVPLQVPVVHIASIGSSKSKSSSSSSSSDSSSSSENMSGDMENSLQQDAQKQQNHSNLNSSSSVNETSTIIVGILFISFLKSLALLY